MWKCKKNGGRGIIESLLIRRLFTVLLSSYPSVNHRVPRGGFLDPHHPFKYPLVLVVFPMRKALRRRELSKPERVGGGGGRTEHHHILPPPPATIVLLRLIRTLLGQVDLP